MCAEGNPQFSTPHRGFECLQDEKTPKEFEEMTPRSTRKRVSPHLSPFAGEVYLEDEKMPIGFLEITPSSTRHLSPKRSPRSSPRFSPHRGDIQHHVSSPIGLKDKSPRSPRQGVSPRVSPNRVDACPIDEKSQRAFQEQVVSQQSSPRSSPRLSPHRGDIKHKHETSPRGLKEKSPRSTRQGVSPRVSPNRVDACPIDQREFQEQAVCPQSSNRRNVCHESSPKSRQTSPQASPKQFTHRSGHHNGKMPEKAEDEGNVYHFEQNVEPNKALEPWFRMLHTVDHIDEYQPKDKSKMSGDIFKNIRDLARLAFRIPDKEMNDDSDNYPADNEEDIYISSEDEQECPAKLGTVANQFQTESQDFDDEGNDVQPYEGNLCQRDEMPETAEDDLHALSYGDENACDFTTSISGKEGEDTDAQLSTATNDEHPLINLLEEEFYALSNPILEAAHTILMKYSKGAYNVRGTDTYLQTTMDWAVSQFSGPSNLSSSENMVRALIRWEPELAAASKVKIPKHTSHNTCSAKLKLHKSKDGLKRNAILDTAHNLTKDFKPESYVPHLCNKMFKDTLQWALSKYTGPSKLSFDKILLKILLGLEKELDNAVGLNLVPLPGVKEIQRNLPKSNPTIVTAQMMLYIISPKIGNIPNADDISFEMLLKSLQWALQKYGNPSVKDPFIKSMVALINAEPYLEEAFENRN